MLMMMVWTDGWAVEEHSAVRQFVERVGVEQVAISIIKPVYDARPVINSTFHMNYNWPQPGVVDDIPFETGQSA